MTDNSTTQNLTTHDFRIRLLIVDDEQTIRRLCMTVGESLGFSCLEAESGDAALALLEEQPVHMVLTDMVMPRMSGLEFLEQVKRAYPRIEVAVMTGHGSVETAVQAMKLGAYDYIAKPFAPLDDLRLFLRRMADKVRLVEENLYLRERSETETSLHGIIGNSTGIQNVLRLISRLKDTRTPVLISGESGTGKELVARALHFRGTMAARPFVAVDCGSLVPTLIESELFGYEKGAFTGALRSKQGLLQSADTGTIFFDEVGELPLEMQAKLLRFLQEKEVRPVGSNLKVKVDVRIMAATNRDLDAEYRKEPSARIFISASTSSPFLCLPCASAVPTFPSWPPSSLTASPPDAASSSPATPSRPCSLTTGPAMSANWKIAWSALSPSAIRASSKSTICLRPSRAPRSKPNLPRRKNSPAAPPTWKI